jgi:tetratricopeptide (TPR) repeat protein
MQSERGTRSAGLRHADGSKAATAGRSRAPEARAPDAWEPEQWVREDGDLEKEAGRAVRRGRTAATRSRGTGRAPADHSAERRGGAADIEADVRAELATAVGNTKVDKFEVRLKDAGRAFEAERFGDAARILKKLADDAPGAPSVRELYGVTLYRQGKWRLAARELEAFRALTDSTEQHPVLADCYRALHQYGKVDELWQELREASPSAELVTEGRIVAAGALADRGDARGSLDLLASGFTFPKRPREHHLRRAYALADAYERVGDVGRARDSFERIAAYDPAFADVRQRIRNLR